MATSRTTLRASGRTRGFATSLRPGCSALFVLARASAAGAAAFALTGIAPAGAQAQVSPGYDAGATQLDVLRPRTQDQGLQPGQPRKQPLFEPALAVDETYTTNVNLQPPDSRQSDFITRITPSVRIFERGARTTLTGEVAAPVLLYVRTAAQNNRVVPKVDLTGKVEAVERLFFVEGAVHVQQAYLSPFGPTSTAIENNPQNAYTSQSYRLSPYVKGGTAGDLTYELRDNNIWTSLGNAPVSTANSYTNELSGNVTRTARPLGWALEYRRTDVEFTSRPDQITEIARARGLYRPAPELELSASFGYERNDFSQNVIENSIYGAGVRWRPDPRTRLDAQWEHRFFGASYKVAFDHRTPLSVWNVNASRDVTSYPQVLAQLGAGAQVSGLLDSLFSSRIPDATERQQFVQRIVDDRGLPAVLSSPVTLFTRNIYLEQRVSATAGLLGARNAVFVTAYRVRTEPVTGEESGLPSALADLLNNNTQTGGTATWTNRITPALTLTTDLDYRHTVANAPAAGTSNQVAAHATLKMPLSANTSLRGGVRYQRLSSDVTDDFDEFAVFVGFTHFFR